MKPPATLISALALALPLAAQQPVPFVSKTPLVALQMDGVQTLQDTFGTANVGKLLANARIKGLYLPLVSVIQMGRRMAETEADVGELTELLYAYQGRMTICRLCADA